MHLLLAFILMAGSTGTINQPGSDSTSVFIVDSTSVSNNGVAYLSDAEWKYQSGDNLEWANPSYDDSNWKALNPYHFNPIDNNIPWEGYGWWRAKIRVDSTFSDQARYLRLFTMGAAEVYLDGKLIKKYGRFSVDSDTEVTTNFITNIFPYLPLEPGQIHTIAIRYSNHKLEKIIFPSQIPDNYSFGFQVGITTQQRNQAFLNIYSYRLFTSSFSVAVLLILFLLHTTLYLKYREDQSNLMIAILLLSFITIMIVAFSESYIKPTLGWYQFIMPVINLLLPFVFLFLPYVVKYTLHLKKISYAKYLIWLTPLPLLISIISEQFNLAYNYGPLSITILCILSLIILGIVIYKAYKEKKQGIKYIAFGALTMMILGIFWSLTNINLISVSYYTEYTIVIFIVTSIPISLTLYIGNRYGYLYGSMEDKVKARTRELEEAYSELQKSLEELKATQNQLIQQEKLASLGQLTAGIAHEIKNPLNFVNNFSDLSVELVEEARDELSAFSTQTSDNGEQISEMSGLLDDIEANLRKINEHGSRADGIVKSMLQHSRGGNGEMEPTDLNALVKEYVNLSFHGMRASENPVNVDIEMELDDSVGEVPLIAEDFSRVIINLCNNAFEAMREKAQLRQGSVDQTNGKGETADDYLPKLMTRTSRDNGQVTIEIEDNGPGIPDDVRDKILQPFFTTKKGTEGTGLGLSITNDIVKAHGGKLMCHSKSNSGTNMIIQISNS